MLEELCTNSLTDSSTVIVQERIKVHHGQPLRTVERERVRQRQPIPAPGARSKKLVVVYVGTDNLHSNLLLTYQPS
ncbi:hypothetical protein E2C01_056775 [Portunus trituberculatus]|uniref:Uncharacterized protein n=1 Tax=Portunus trituberculatus TaxID=210409 RepID=A0A5B7GYM7_PORTR|nr:hypothetical protein [Portunus trituberculatus]